MKLQLPIVELANGTIVDVSEIALIGPVLIDYKRHTIRIQLKYRPLNYESLNYPFSEFSKDQTEKQRQHLAEKWSEYKQLMLKK